MNIKDTLKRIAVKEQELHEITSPLEAVIYQALCGYGEGHNTRVDSYTLDEGTLNVGYSWSCMGSVDSSSLDIPISVLESDNPFEAAKAEKAAKKEAEHQAAIQYQKEKEEREFQRLKAKFEPEYV